LFPAVNVRLLRGMTTAPRRFSFPLLAAGALGLTGVALGAMGAHALKATLIERGMTQAWETAARYHLFHAVALLGLAAWQRAGGPDSLETRETWIGGLWVAGVILFSGSLYGLALGGPRWLGPVTPLGGVFMMIGWVLVVRSAWVKRA
jgi:uncharacterized membrane protein YgdD (TMEM256/DUF423 family)